MKKTFLSISGVFLIKPYYQSDLRGEFYKFFHSQNLFNKKYFNVAESYFSNSKPNVFRGMHFQAPPDDHEKYVTCVKGDIIDFVTDLRPSSETYLQTISCKLSSTNKCSIYIPRGCAHGFYSLTHSTVMYMVDTPYKPESDIGFNYLSIKNDLKLNENPVLSDRDKKLPLIEKVNNYFK